MLRKIRKYLLLTLILLFSGFGLMYAQVRQGVGHAPIHFLEQSLRTHFLGQRVQLPNVYGQPDHKQKQNYRIRIEKSEEDEEVPAVGFLKSQPGNSSFFSNACTGPKNLARWGAGVLFAAYIPFIHESLPRFILLRVIRL